MAPNKATGIKDVGTLHQYRRLVELGWTQESRSLKLGTRLLFRLVSRDEDPKLLFEYQKFGAAEVGVEPWVREVIREATAAARNDQMSVVSSSIHSRMWYETQGSPAA